MFMIFHHLKNLKWIFMTQILIFMQFLSGIIQYSSTDSISADLELNILEEVYNIFTSDRKALYFTLLRYQIEENKRSNTPNGIMKHRFLTHIPNLFSTTIKERKNISDAIYKLWDIFLSLEPE